MKVSLAKALLNQRCPTCREGKMFKTSSFNVHFMEMNKKCPHCQVMLEPEPGFYQGAMYVGYAFSVAIVVAVSLLVKIVDINSPWISIGIVSVITLLLVPFNFRYSRVLFLYMFGGLQGKART
ncbi:MAG: DUF983 domain-containing protein [Chryseotalea sp.]